MNDRCGKGEMDQRESERERERRGKEREREREREMAKRKRGLQRMSERGTPIEMNSKINNN